MDKLRGLLGITRMDRVLNIQIRELCGVMKGMDERIDEDVLWRFSHVEKMENDRIAKRIYVRECAGSYWKRWIDTVKECFRKRGLDVRQARRMVQDRSNDTGIIIIIKLKIMRMVMIIIMIQGL